MFAKSSMLDVPHGFEYASPPPQDHSDVLGDLLHEVLNFIVVSSCGYRNERRLGRDLQNLAKREGGLKTYSNRGSYPSKEGDSTLCKKLDWGGWSMTYSGPKYLRLLKKHDHLIFVCFNCIWLCILRKKIASQTAYHLTSWWYWERQQEVCGLRWSIGGGSQEGKGLGLLQRGRFDWKEIQTGCTPWVQGKPISFKWLIKVLIKWWKSI